MTMRTKVIHCALRHYNSRPWTLANGLAWWRWWARLPPLEGTDLTVNPYHSEPRRMVAPGIWR